MQLRWTKRDGIKRLQMVVARCGENVVWKDVPSAPESIESVIDDDKPIKRVELELLTEIVKDLVICVAGSDLCNISTQRGMLDKVKTLERYLYGDA